MKEAPRSIENADAIRAALKDGARELTAFCHWNANIDNAWYWRDERGDLACGLMDWGNVGQLNKVTAIQSSLVFAEPEFLIENLGQFFELFSKEFENAGGGPLDPVALELQFALQTIAGGAPVAAGYRAADRASRSRPGHRHRPVRPAHRGRRVRSYATPPAQGVLDVVAIIRSPRTDRLGDPPRLGGPGRRMLGTRTSTARLWEAANDHGVMATVRRPDSRPGERMGRPWRS